MDTLVINNSSITCDVIINKGGDMDKIHIKKADAVALGIRLEEERVATELANSSVCRLRLASNKVVVLDERPWYNHIGRRVLMGAPIAYSIIFMIAALS